MEIIKIEDYIEDRFKTCIALGNFDGIHIGHRNLILSMMENAKTFNLISSVLLFREHPKDMLTGKSPELLTSLEDKEELLEKIGLDIIYEKKFTKEFSKLSPEEFVKEILVDKLNVHSVFVGFDYRFGFKASGDIETLKKLGHKYHFKVYIIEPVYYEASILSSSEIRNHIKEGNIKLVNKMLYRNYKIKGQVVHGSKIGRTLGFPTANIKLSNNYSIPKNGVYETKTIVYGKKYRSLTSIGTNPTVGGDTLKIENYILDFDMDIYDKKIEVEFIKYIREEMMFGSLEDLKLQMKKDLEKIKY